MKQNINTEPWNISLWERLKVVTEKGSTKKVVYIYEKADTSTFRYRVYNMFQTLQGSSAWEATYFFENELDKLTDYVGNFDVVVFARTRWSVEMDDFIDLVKKHKIPTAFDIDDLVCSLENLPLVMNTLNVDFKHPDCYSHWFSYSSRLWLMGKLCDATIGTNQYLCQRLAKVFNKPSFEINNFLNHEQISYSEKIFNDRQSPSNKKHFTIGYFSGTPSHINDFNVIAPEIKELLAEFPDIRLKVVGFMEFPKYLKEFLDIGQIQYTHLVDFLTLQKKIAEVDVNIVPLVNNEFTNCKSELKFFEAAIVGSVTCATPTYVYTGNIREGETGFICKEGEWYKTLKKIYVEGINNKMITDAREYCLKKYSPANQLRNIEETLDKVASTKV